MAEPSLISAEPLVQRTLLGKQIADILRREILFGSVRPGTRLSQQQLCERFGTSRMPVRDALRTLTQLGFLLTDQANHTIVAPLSRSDLLDSYIIEGTLSGIAAERASRLASQTDLDHLQNLHEGMVACEQNGAAPVMAELNWKLHRDINRMARSRKLLVVLRSISLDVPRDFLTELPELIRKSNEDHAAILKAMSAGNHLRVGSLMTDHILDSGKSLITLLETKGLELD
jgi:DNA-binding GntR family transcriptional regulator